MGSARARVETARPHGRLFRAVRIVLKALLPILIVGGAVGAYAKLKATKPQPPKRPQLEKVWPVEAVAIKFTSLKPTLRLYGETVAGRTLDIRSLVAGEVVETGRALREGGIARKGETLLVIDPFDFEGAAVEARARLDEARARLTELRASFKLEQDALAQDQRQLALAIKDLERAKPLAKRGTVSKKLVDDRQVVVTQRTQAVEQRQNNLKIWRAKSAQQKAIIARFEWGVRQARRRLAQTRLEAPFDAYVASVTAEVGRRLGVNDKVATLLDRNWVEVRFTLSNKQYGRIIGQSGTLVGREVAVNWHVGDAPIAYRARIERVAATISAASGGISVYARIADPTAPTPIRPGAFVEILVPDRTYDAVARVPETALYGGDTLYVIRKGRLEPHKVRVVGLDGRSVLVRGNLAAGDHVMRTRLSVPGKGLRVEER